MRNGNGGGARPIGGKALKLKVDAARSIREDLLKIRAVLEGHPGATPVELTEKTRGGDEVLLAAGERLGVERSAGLLNELAEWL